MVFIKKLVSVFYAILLFVTGAVFILAVSRVVPAEEWAAAIDVISSDTSYQAVVGVLGLVLAVTGIVLPFRVAKRLRRGRQITFQNPDGEVTISISAIEEYIQKISKDVSGISNVRSRVSFGRKGITIAISLNITAGANIPKLTEDIQSEIKEKVRSMLGIEEQITMVMNVNKIAGKMPAGADHVPADEHASREVPFR